MNEGLTKAGLHANRMYSVALQKKFAELLLKQTEIEKKIIKQQLTMNGEIK